MNKICFKCNLEKPMTPYEYFIEEGYPSEIAEELAKYLGGYNEQLHNSSEKENS